MRADNPDVGTKGPLEKKMEITIYWLYFGFNLLKSYGYQLPQRYVNSQLTKAQSYHTKQLEERLKKIVEGLEGEELAKALYYLHALTDALVLQARADFHVGKGRCTPESAAMLLTFVDEQDNVHHDRIAVKPYLPLSSPNEAGRDDWSPKPAPQQRLAAMLGGVTTEEAGTLLSHAKFYLIHFDEMRRLMESYLELRIDTRTEKSKGKFWWTPERGNIRSCKRKAKSELQDRQNAIRRIDKYMNRLKGLEQIAKPIKDSYDRQIRSVAERLSTECGVETELIVAKPQAKFDDLPHLCSGLYALVRENWDKAVCSRYDKNMLKNVATSKWNLLNVDLSRYPRWTKMRKTGTSAGDHLTRIGTPTEIMKQEIAKILNQIRTTAVLTLVRHLEKEVNTLKADVVLLERAQMEQLDDMIGAFGNVSDESDELAIKMLPVLREVRKKAQLRKVEAHLIKRQSAKGER